MRVDAIERPAVRDRRDEARALFVAPGLKTDLAQGPVASWLPETSPLGRGADVAAAPRPPAVATADDERGRLPVGGLMAMVGSGAFAVWTSLTCFVC